jgi:hypothetical protein
MLIYWGFREYFAPLAELKPQPWSLKFSTLRFEIDRQQRGSAQKVA